MKKILCFAPHPDDEILGCGGSLIKAVDKKLEVHVCYLTFGEQGSPKFSPSKLKLIRKKESLDACQSINIPAKNVYFMGIPDNQISRHDFVAFKKIMRLIRKIKPNLVYLPHEGENYQDHREASLLVQRALDMAGSNNFIQEGSAWWVDNVLAYEVSTPMGKYQYSEDISNEIDRKIIILKKYKSQTAHGGNASDFVGVKAKMLHGFRAAMTIGEYREAFQVIRAVNIL